MKSAIRNGEFFLRRNRNILDECTQMMYPLLMADVFYGDFVWDKRKNEKNKIAHGISFEFAAHVFQDPYLFEFPVADKNSSPNETRYDVIGCVNGVCLVFVACTDRGEKIRIISARKATKSERRLYEENVKRI